MNRGRQAVLLITLALMAAGIGCSSRAAASSDVGEGYTVEVMLTPTCGCCKQWVQHMRDHGFEVNAHEMPGDQINAFRAENNIGPPLAGCHLARVEGYIVEGHTPADLVARMLEERPDIAGISTPGMPIGSPGMESPNPQPYRVLAFDENGEVTSVYARR